MLKKKRLGKKRLGFEIRGEQFGKMMTRQSQDIEKAKQQGERCQYVRIVEGM